VPTTMQPAQLQIKQSTIVDKKTTSLNDNDDDMADNATEQNYHFGGELLTRIVLRQRWAKQQHMPGASRKMIHNTPHKQESQQSTSQFDAIITISVENINITSAITNNDWRSQQIYDRDGRSNKHARSITQNETQHTSHKQESQQSTMQFDAISQFLVKNKEIHQP